MGIIHMQTEDVQALARKMQVSGDQIGEVLRDYYTTLRGLEMHWNGQSADEYRQVALELWKTLDTLRGRLDELSVALNREINQWLEMDVWDGKDGAAALHGGKGEIHQVKRYKTGSAQQAAGEGRAGESMPYEKVVAHRYVVARGTGRTVWRAYYRDEAGELVYEDLPYSTKKPMPTHRSVPPPNLQAFNFLADSMPDAAASSWEDPYKEGYIAKGNLIKNDLGQEDAGPALKWQHGYADPGIQVDNGIEQHPDFGNEGYIAKNLDPKGDG